MKHKSETREKIEAIVSSHTIWNKVAQYYAEKTGKTRDEIHEKFIDFLVRENFDLIENKPRNVLCFVFNTENMEFENKTVFGIHDDAY